MKNRFVQARAFKIWQETQNPDSVANWYEALKQLREEALFRIKGYTSPPGCCPECYEIYGYAYYNQPHYDADMDECPPTSYDLGHPCDFCGC